MFFPAVVALFFFFSAAFASPLFRRQSAACSPNFEGVSVSVTNSAREWQPAKPVVSGADVLSPIIGSDGRPGLVTTDFRFEQIGQPDQPPLYIIKPVEDNNLVVNFDADGTLSLKPFSQTDSNQNWNVVCDFCGTDASNFSGQFSFGCNITSAVTGQCVQIDEDKTKPMFLAGCNGEDSQNFDFWTSAEF